MIRLLCVALFALLCACSSERPYLTTGVQPSGAVWRVRGLIVDPKYKEEYIEVDAANAPASGIGAIVCNAWCMVFDTQPTFVASDRQQYPVLLHGICRDEKCT